MLKDLWINLPVKDIERSKKFYSGIGFKLNEKYSGQDSLSYMIGNKEMILMLFKEDMFESFTRSKVSDTSLSSEVLFSIGAESREDVDQLVKNAEASGGTVFSEAAEVQGWMYGCGVADPDGHRWNAVYMDFSKR